jgi:hypothetical protein
MKSLQAILFFWISLMLGCSPDYQVSDKQEVRVVVDSYIQPAQLGALDVLVVLDTSGSMSDNYEDVADGMELLRVDIESLTLDYQFGYITMDPTSLSYLGPYDSSATAIDMLMAPSLLSSTFYEEGFGATYTFFGSEEGLMFMRPEADFLLFLISDEDEQSAISSGLFYDWMHAEFDDVAHDVVCVVNPDDDTGNNWTNEVGYKYIELANLYGKDVVDLRTEDWSVWLSDSSYLIQQKDSIALTEVNPIIDSIVVYVNRTIVNGWSYNDVSNTVQLGFTPDPEAIIEVGYNIYVD